MKRLCETAHTNNKAWIEQMCGQISEEDKNVAIESTGGLNILLTDINAIITAYSGEIGFSLSLIDVPSETSDAGRSAALPENPQGETQTSSGVPPDMAAITVAAVNSSPAPGGGGSQVAPVKIVVPVISSEPKTDTPPVIPVADERPAQADTIPEKLQKKIASLNELVESIRSRIQALADVPKALSTELALLNAQKEHLTQSI